MGPARGSASAILLPVLLFLLAGCASESYPPFRQTDLRGDPAVLSRFAGDWYSAGVLWLRVEPHRERLEVRWGPGAELGSANTVGDEIRFFASFRHGHRAEYTLFAVEADRVAVVPLAARHRARPWLGRLRLADLVRRAQRRVHASAGTARYAACDSLLTAGPLSGRGRQWLACPEPRRPLPVLEEKERDRLKAEGSGESQG